MDDPRGDQPLENDGALIGLPDHFRYPIQELVDTLVARLIGVFQRPGAIAWGKLLDLPELRVQPLEEEPPPARMPEESDKALPAPVSAEVKSEVKSETPPEVLRTLIEQALESVNSMSVSIQALQRITEDSASSSKTRIDALAGQVQSVNESLEELNMRLGKVQQQLADTESAVHSLDAKLSADVGFSSAAVGGAPLPEPVPVAHPAELLYSAAPSDCTAGGFESAHQELGFNWERGGEEEETAIAFREEAEVLLPSALEVKVKPETAATPELEVEPPVEVEIPHPAPAITFAENRSERRPTLKLPIRIRAHSPEFEFTEITETANVSRSGVYFLSDKLYQWHGDVRVAVPFDSKTPEQNVEFRATIVRIDQNSGRGVRGIALHIPHISFKMT